MMIPDCAAPLGMFMIHSVRPPRNRLTDAAEGWSVIVKGTARMLCTNEELEEAERAQLLPWTATLKQHYVRIHPVSITGRRFRFGNQPDSWMEIIGVVRDTGARSLSADDVLARQPSQFYRSYTQAGLVPATVMARTSGDAAVLLGAMQRELRAMDVTLPVITAQTMAQDIERSQAAPKVVATFLGALGGLALVLASIGLYAVVAFAVARRSRD